MKKILTFLILNFLLIPNIVFAANTPTAATLVKFWEDNTNEYYTYDYMKDGLIVGDDNVPLAKALDDGLITISDAMKSIDGIYPKKKNTDDLIIPSNFIKYSIRDEENVIIDYYLYTAKIGSDLEKKDWKKMCDKNQTICFDLTTDTLILNGFEGENLYISKVDTNGNEKVDNIKMVVENNNVISSASGDVALNVTDNPLTIESDKEDKTLSSDYSNLNIESGSIGIGGSGKLTLKNIQMGINVNMKTGTDDAYGIFGVGLDLNLDNATVVMSLDLVDDEQSYKELNGAGISLIDSAINIKDSFISIESIVNGVLIGNEKTKNFNIDESVVLISTSRESDDLVEENYAMVLQNVKLTNSGEFFISDDINTNDYSVTLENVELNDTGVFWVSSESSKATLMATDSKLSFNGKMLMVYNFNEDKDDKVNSMELIDSTLSINEDLKKNPSSFEVDEIGCADGQGCDKKIFYKDNKLIAVATIDKLKNEDKDILVIPPEKIEMFADLKVIDEGNDIYKGDWLNTFKNNIGSSSIIKIYEIEITTNNLSINDELYNLVLPDGTYKIYIPIPSDIDKYENINIYTLNYDQNSVSKQLKYSKSEDSKYYILEVSKEDIENGIKFTILGESENGSSAPSYSCKYIDGKYYSKDGSIVDKKTYESVCGIKDNPHTGITLPIILFIVLIGLGIFVYKTKDKDLFRKI